MFDALFAQDFEGGIVIVRLGVVMAAEVGRQVGGGEGAIPSTICMRAAQLWSTNWGMGNAYPVNTYP